jgi:hypothetical protein
MTRSPGAGQTFSGQGSAKSLSLVAGLLGGLLGCLWKNVLLAEEINCIGEMTRRLGVGMRKVKGKGKGKMLAVRWTLSEL